MNTDDDRLFSLGPGDSAVIFRSDGSEEVRTPAGKGSDFVPETAYKCLQAVMALHDPETLEFIDGRINDRRTNNANESPPK